MKEISWSVIHLSGKPMRDFLELKVWGKAHPLVLAIYKISAGFPQKEIYTLTSQIRRAAISIASNIAEGCGRSTETEFARFLQIAMGSASEVEYQVLLARDLGSLNSLEFEKLDSNVPEVKRMLTGLIRKLSAEI
jgi:four helix bundle protein